MVRIKMIDGIPCIVLNEEKVKKVEDKEYYRMRNEFTFIQQSKEAKSFKAVYDELKDKLKE